MMIFNKNVFTGHFIYVLSNFQLDLLDPVLDLILIMWGGHTEENWNNTQKISPH